jgi:HAD superfamily hydrolase (TIGR01509 family)
MSDDKQIKALLLDLDGTLADSLDAMKNIHDDFLSQFGKTAAKGEHEELNGPPLPTIIEILKERHQLEPGQEELLAIYRKSIKDAYAEIQPFTGVLELFEIARQQDIKIAVVTSNQKELTQDWLQEHRLFPYVSFVVSGEDTEEHKPHPAPYLRALELLDCPVENAVAVDDSTLGLQSAVAAGIHSLPFENPSDGSPNTFEELLRQLL